MHLKLAGACFQCKPPLSDIYIYIYVYIYIYICICICIYIYISYDIIHYTGLRHAGDLLLAEPGALGPGYIYIEREREIHIYIYIYMYIYIYIIIIVIIIVTITVSLERSVQASLLAEQAALLCFCGLRFSRHIIKLFTLLDLCVSPCAGAMLILSVSFQFQRMIPEGNPKV